MNGGKEREGSKEQHSVEILVLLNVSRLLLKPEEERLTRGRRIFISRVALGLGLTVHLEDFSGHSFGSQLFFSCSGGTSSIPLSLARARVSRLGNPRTIKKEGNRELNILGRC